MFRFMFHTKEEGPTEAFQSNLFERFADEVRVNLIPEIANAIDDETEKDHEDMRIHALTNILARLCSVAEEDVLDGVKEWRDFVLHDGLSYGWIELL